MTPSIDRKRIYIFLAITYSFSIAVGLVLFFNGGLVGSSLFVLKPLANLLMTGLMFTPLLANIVTRLVTREGWSNTLLRPNIRHGWSFYLAAWLLPILATIVGGVFYYLVFPSRFDLSMEWARQEGLVLAGPDQNMGTFFIFKVVNALIIALTLGLILSFGEEFGWRAYLLPKLMPLGGRKAALLVGLIHGPWHWPFILMGYEYGFGYWGEPISGFLLFVLFTVCLSVFLSWVTLRAGSVWPAAIGHAAVNASPLLMLYFVRGTPNLLIGPLMVGIVAMLGYFVLALLLFFSRGALAPIADTRRQRNP